MRAAGGPIDFSAILVALLVLVVAALVVPPLWSLVTGSLHRTTETGATGDFTFDYYRRLLADRRFFESLANSVTLRPRQRGARPRLRRRRRLARRADQCAVQGLRLSHGDRFARHAFRPLCHGLAVSVRPRGPLNDLLRCLGGDRPGAVQCLFAPRHDPHRRLAVVADGLPASVGRLRRRQCRLRGCRAHVRRGHRCNAPAAFRCGSLCPAFAPWRCSS